MLPFVIMKSFLFNLLYVCFDNSFSGSDGDEGGCGDLGVENK